jgi:DNA-binding GntR family transcriptional regulator
MDTNALLRKPETLRSHVENFLRNAIMSGRFQPGERLKERELCELLDVSRPSQREALRRLEAEKLIVTIMHRGPVVASISEAEVRELYAVRRLLEGYAVFEFARRADDAEILALGNIVRQLHAAAGQGDTKALLDAKSAVYTVILGGCGNALAREMLLGLLSRINLLRATSFSRPDRLVESLREIDQLYERIKARDGIGAQQAAHLHVANAEQAALVVLCQQAAARRLAAPE